MAKKMDERTIVGEGRGISQNFLRIKRKRFFSLCQPRLFLPHNMVDYGRGASDNCVTTRRFPTIGFINGRRGSKYYQMRDSISISSTSQPTFVDLFQQVFITVFKSLNYIFKLFVKQFFSFLNPPLLFNLPLLSKLTKENKRDLEPVILKHLSSYNMLYVGLFLERS